MRPTDMLPEALIVVGIVAALLGALLLAIGLFAARWYYRRHPDSQATTRHITKAGAILFGLMTASWVAGLIWTMGHPSGWVARLLEYGGIEVFVIVFAVPFLMVGFLLESRGIRFVSTKDDRG